MYVKGDPEKVMKFFKDGIPELKATKPKEFEKELIESQCSLRSWFPIPETFKEVDTANPKRDLFFFMQDELKAYKELEKFKDIINTLYDTYLSKGTTTNNLLDDLFEKYKNYSNSYDSHVKEQQEKYGVVGWYDYNLMTLGVKWNADIEIGKVILDPNLMIVCTSFNTPWDIPYLWLIKIHEKYQDLHFIVFSEEESGAFTLFSDNCKVIESCDIDLYDPETYSKRDDLFESFIQYALS